jgi:hypothetical protein
LLRCGLAWESIDRCRRSVWLVDVRNVTRVNGVVRVAHPLGEVAGDVRRRSVLRAPHEQRRDFNRSQSVVQPHFGAPIPEGDDALQIARFV